MEDALGDPGPHQCAKVRNVLFVQTLRDVAGIELQVPLKAQATSA
jgi:hypothetical protein